MNDKQITCREFVELVGAHLDGNMPASQSASFDAHLARCPRCRQYLASYKATVSLARAAMKGCEEQSSDSVTEELVKSIMRRRARRK